MSDEMLDVERKLLRLRADYEALKARHQELKDYAELLFDVLKEVDECAEYWSEYYVPVGLPERIREAVQAGVRR